VLLGLTIGDVVTNIVMFVQAAGSGTVPTSMTASLHDVSGNLLANTADIKTSWNSGTTYKVMPLTGAFTILSTGGYYVGLNMLGSFSVSQPAPLAFTLVDSDQLVGTGITGAALETDMTGLVGTPNPLTFGALSGNQWIWAAVS
jgi:hypothetical protein